MAKTTKTTTAEQRPLFCTAGKLAKVLGISEPTPVNWWKRGKLPGIKIGECVRFPIAEIAALLGIKPEDLQ